MISDIQGIIWPTPSTRHLFRERRIKDLSLAESILHHYSIIDDSTITTSMSLFGIDSAFPSHSHSHSQFYHFNHYNGNSYCTIDHFQLRHLVYSWFPHVYYHRIF